MVKAALTVSVHALSVMIAVHGRHGDGCCGVVAFAMVRILVVVFAMGVAVVTVVVVVIVAVVSNMVSTVGGIEIGCSGLVREISG